MKKLKLDLENLSVESFDTDADGEPERGTVRGHDYTEMWEGCPERQTRYEEYTCGVSCIYMCFHTLEVPGCGRNTDFGCL